GACRSRTSRPHPPTASLRVPPSPARGEGLELAGEKAGEGRVDVVAERGARDETFAFVEAERGGERFGVAGFEAEVGVAALRLYESEGFVPCAPFGDYVDTP